MKKIMIIITLLYPLLLQTVQAGLMKSYAYETTVNDIGPRGGTFLEEASDLLDRTLIANYIVPTVSTYNQTWAGASQGWGNSTGGNLGFTNYSYSIINGITISYMGEGEPESNSIDGSVHVSNAVNVDGDTGVLASSFFDVNLIVANNLSSINLRGNDLINNLFTWNTNMSFLLDQPFSLSIDSRLRVKGGHVRSGYYKTALGGSPVFILPNGFSANSADGSIVNNNYVGFNPLKQVNQVPEPSTALLMLFAVALFGRRLSTSKP